MKDFKTIVKFTMKDVFFRKTFLITNIIMMFVIIFLSRMIIKIGDITENYVDKTTQVTIENAALTDNLTDEGIESIKQTTKSSVNSTIGTAFNSGFIIAFILFFSIYFYGYMVSNSIASEKTSRVLETLIVSTSPESIVLGKTIAMGLLGIGQMFFLMIVATFSFADSINLKLNFNDGIGNIFKNFGLAFKFGIEKFSLGFSNDINLSVGISAPILILLFFIFGYLFYAFICAIAGAGISKAEDIQVVNGPISIVAMIAFYMAAFTTSMPNSNWTPWVKYLPFSSAFAMPVNIINGVATNYEIIITLLILVLSSIWLAFMSIKVYKHVIFNYGNRTSIKDILKIIFLQK